MSSSSVSSVPEPDTKPKMMSWIQQRRARRQLETTFKGILSHHLFQANLALMNKCYRVAVTGHLLCYHQLVALTLEPRFEEQKVAKEVKEMMEAIQSCVDFVKPLARDEALKDIQAIRVAREKREDGLVTMKQKHIVTVLERSLYGLNMQDLCMTPIQLAPHARLEESKVQCILDNESEVEEVKHLLTRQFKHVSWTDIIGYEHIKKEMTQIMDKFLHRRSHELSSAGPPRYGVMLHGPPGTGKTQFVEALATAAEKNVYYMAVRSSDIKSKWVGESDRNISRIFTLARELAPTILFFDEGEQLFGKRTDQGEHDAAISGLLLQEMQQSQDVICIMATNFPWMIDIAFQRRFSTKFFVDLPDPKAKALLFKHSLRNRFILLGPEHYEWLAQNSDRLTASDIAQLNGHIEAEFADIVDHSEYYRFCKYRKDTHITPCAANSSGAIHRDMLDCEEGGVYKDHPLLFFSDIKKVFQTKCIPTTSKQDAEDHRKYAKDNNYNPIDRKKAMEEMGKQKSGKED